MRNPTPIHRYELLPVDQDQEVVEECLKPVRRSNARKPPVVMAMVLGLLFMVLGVAFA